MCVSVSTVGYIARANKDQRRDRRYSFHFRRYSFNPRLQSGESNDPPLPWVRAIGQVPSVSPQLSADRQKSRS
jgi:hypothetical protein